MTLSDLFRKQLRHITRWSVIAALVGILAGTSSAFFLAILRMATAYREQHPAAILLLPIAGLLVGWLYHRFGSRLDAGNNLILDEIHDPRRKIPLRMVPFVLIGTVLTHLFGGSAGREGTAVQMGGALADQLSAPFRMSADDRRTLLMAGMSGGFGSVFGVPFAGALFGIEVLSVGRVHRWAVIECTIASFVGHFVVLAWGAHHAEYARPTLPQVSLGVAFWLVFTSVLFGLCAMAFARLTHVVSHLFQRFVAYPPLRPMLGGGLVALGFYALGSLRYAGLGTPVIEEAFQRALGPEDFALKLGFTALTLGSGFKGGEVTPLLFVGATLGNALASIVPISFSALAALGFVAVFAGAANTPVTCTVMAMEVFGPSLGLFALISCLVSYYSSGHAGIYTSQRIGIRKTAYLRKLIFLFHK